MKIEVPNSAPPFIAQLIENGGWEEEECAIIQKAINGHRVLEGGSCLGVTSALLSRRADKVISFEANPFLAKVARRNQKLNGSSAEIVNAALGTKDGEATFIFSRDLWDSKLSSKDGEKVPVMDARRIMRENEINALVLDVEGEESDILAKADLSNIDVILVEIHQQVDKKKILNKLNRSGFKIKFRQDKSTHSIVWAQKDKGLIGRLFRPRLTI